MLIMHVDPDAVNNAMTEEELRTIVDVSHEDGVIESDEKEMIYNVFDLGDANAKDIMVPKVHVTFASVDNTYEELIDIFREDKFTRLPVYEETQDNIVGIINMKDLLLYDANTEFHMKDFLREPHFTYEYKNISELLVEMRILPLILPSCWMNMAKWQDSSHWRIFWKRSLVRSTTSMMKKKMNWFSRFLTENISLKVYELDDVNDHLNTKLESEDYDSLGGFIIEHLDRLPATGDEVMTEDGIRLVVEKLDKNRVESVHIYLPESDVTASDTHTETAAVSSDDSSEQKVSPNMKCKPLI